MQKFHLRIVFKGATYLQDTIIDYGTPVTARRAFRVARKICKQEQRLNTKYNHPQPIGYEVYLLTLEEGV